MNFAGASYSNSELAQRHDLVGQPIWVINHLEDDARIALATTREGVRLGVLRAHPPWHQTPHSLAIRSAINAMVRRRRFSLASGADAVTAFMEYVESTAKGKLPIHPSYLEIKRLLLEHAPSRSGDTEAADAKARLKSAIAPSEEDTRDAEPVARAAAPVVKSRPPLARSALPPLRKAAN